MRLPVCWGPYPTLLLLLLLLLCGLARAMSACPHPCACYTPTELHCTFRTLPAVPSGIAQDVERINLGFNSILALSDASFAGMKRLELLLLHGNEIGSIPDGALRDLSSLQVLKLSYNKLRVLTRHTLQGLAGLVRLHLDHNQLEFMHPEAFRGLMALRLLHLEGNALQHLHPDTFATFSVLGHFQLSTIRHLYLGENGLSRLPQGMLGAMPLLENLYLHANPWACDCQTRWFLDWPVRSKGVLKCKKDKVYPGGQLCAACASPRTFQNQELQTLTEVTCAKPLVTSPLRQNGSRVDTDTEDHYEDEHAEEARSSLLPHDVMPTPTWNVTLNMTDEHGNAILLECDVSKPESLSNVKLNQTDTLEINVTAEVQLDLTCPMTRENYEKLWKLLAYYSEVPVRLQQAVAVDTGGRRGYQYRQDEDADTLYYTGVRAQVYAEPLWITQPAIEIQLDRRLSSARKVLLSYRARYSQTVSTKHSTQARSAGWVMIEPGPENQRNQIVLEGRPCELSCRVKASDSPSIFWILPGGTVLKAPMDDDGKFSVLNSGWLRIKSAKRSDSGVYQCMARVREETDRMAYRVLVFPSTDSPQEHPVLSTIRKDPGDSAMLPCTSSAAPEAVMAWILPNNRMVSPAGNLSNAHMSPDGTLHVPHVHMGDGGLYTCVALNRLGQDQFTVEMTVQSRFPKGGRRRHGPKGFPRIQGDVVDDESGSGEEVTSWRTDPPPKDRAVGLTEVMDKKTKKGRRKPKVWNRLEQAPQTHVAEGRRVFESRRRVNVASKHIHPEHWADILARVRGKNIPRATDAPGNTQYSTLPAQTPPEMTTLAAAASPPTESPEPMENKAEEASADVIFTQLPEAAEDDVTIREIRTELHSGASRSKGLDLEPSTWGGELNTSPSSTPTSLETHTLPEVNPPTQVQEEKEDDYVQREWPGRKGRRKGTRKGPGLSERSGEATVPAFRHVSPMTSPTDPAVITVMTSSTDTTVTFITSSTETEVVTAMTSSTNSTVATPRMTSTDTVVTPMMSTKDTPSTIPMTPSTDKVVALMTSSTDTPVTTPVMSSTGSAMVPEWGTDDPRQSPPRSGSRRRSGQKKKLRLHRIRHRPRPKMQVMQGPTDDDVKTVPNVIYTAVGDDVITTVPNDIFTTIGDEVFTTTHSDDVITPVSDDIITTIPNDIITSVPFDVVTSVPDGVITSIPSNVISSVPDGTIPFVPDEVIVMNGQVTMENSDDDIVIGESVTSFKVYLSRNDVQKANPSTHHPDREETTDYDVTVHLGDATGTESEAEGDVTKVTTDPSQSGTQAVSTSPAVATAAQGIQEGFPAVWTSSSMSSLSSTWADNLWTYTPDPTVWKDESHQAPEDQHPAGQGGATAASPDAWPARQYGLTLAHPHRAAQPSLVQTLETAPSTPLPTSAGSHNLMTSFTTRSEALPTQRPTLLPRVEENAPENPTGRLETAHFALSKEPSTSGTVHRASILPPTQAGWDLSPRPEGNPEVFLISTQNFPPHVQETGDVTPGLFPDLSQSTLALGTSRSPQPITHNPLRHFSTLYNPIHSASHPEISTARPSMRGVATPRSTQYSTQIPLHWPTARVGRRFRDPKEPPNRVSGGHHLPESVNRIDLAPQLRPPQRPGGRIPWIPQLGVPLGPPAPPGPRRPPHTPLTVYTHEPPMMSVAPTPESGRPGGTDSRVKPHIQSGVLRSIMVPPGADVIIPCMAPGETPLRVTWTHLTTGTVLTPITQIQRFKVLRNGSLVIRQVQQEDQGQYLCSARTLRGLDSALTVLAVSAQRSQDLTVQLGDSVSLECLARGNPVPPVSWLLPDGSQWRSPTPPGVRVALLTNRTLRIRGVTPADAGPYVCVAGADRFALVLHVAAWPPRMQHVRAENLSVPAGQSTWLPCSVVAAPRASLRWVLPDGAQVRPAQVLGTKYSVFTNGTLLIRDLGARDAGRYNCEATNVLGWAQRTVHLGVRSTAATARITSATPHSTHVRYGARLQLHCSASGHPGPRILWRLPSLRLLDALFSFDSRVQVFRNGTLVIPSVTEQDSGEYLCIARNAVGDDSAVLRVHVLMTPARIEHKENDDHWVPQGSDLRVDCVATGLPNPEISWGLPDGRVLHPVVQSARIGGWSKRYVVFNNGTLYFNEVGAEEEGDYTCFAENQVGRDQMHVRVKVVAEPPVIRDTDVMDRPSIIQNTDLMPKLPVIWNSEVISGRPIIQNSDNLSRPSTIQTVVMARPPVIQNKTYSVLQVRYGDSVTVPCQAIGQPAPHVTWWSPTHRQIPEDSDKYLVDHHGTLHIHKAQRSDSGEYTCSARNSAGEDQKVVRVHITVRAPSFNGRHDMITPLSAPMGTRKLIDCQADGVPTPTVLWAFPEGVILPAPYQGSRIQVHANGTLELRDLRRSDSAQLQCIARNEGGEARMTVDLRVLDSVSGPIFHDPVTEHITASASHTISLNCSVSGTPRPSLLWLLPNGTELHSGQRLQRFFHKTDGMLHVSALAESDAGTYRCVAGNAGGRSNRLVFLKVGLKTEVAKQEVSRPEVIKSEGGRTEDRKQEVSKPEARMPEVAKQEVSRPEVKSEAVKHRPSVVSIINGETLRLPCMAAHPQGRFSWTLPNGMVLEGPQSQGRVSVLENGTLTVQHISVFDRGTYACRAGGRSDPVVTSIPVIVIAYPPRITSEPTPVIYIRPGNPVKLNCLAMGIPKPEVSWELPDNSLLTAGLQARVYGNWFLHPQGSLTIQHASASDAGLYRCTAKNILGMDVKTTYIHVY